MFYRKVEASLQFRPSGYNPIIQATYFFVYTQNDKLCTAEQYIKSFIALYLAHSVSTKLVRPMELSFILHPSDEINLLITMWPALHNVSLQLIKYALRPS